MSQFGKTKILTTGTHKDFEIILGDIEKNKVSLQTSLESVGTGFGLNPEQEWTQA